MARRARPKPPASVDPVKWEHFKLLARVKEALYALPGHFKTSTLIEGMLASDIFTLNAALAATIEEQVVSTLNAMRAVWDPDKKYLSYTFVRQAQTFPDVLLRRKRNGTDILLGIELKGWYLLAKERMPNFRFKATAGVCAPCDLLVVVPWVLSNVLAGSPIVYSPFIAYTRFCAEQRTYYWQHEKGGDGNKDIVFSKAAKPYPSSKDQISDRAVSDAGGNFGRLARYGIMKEYVEQMMTTEISGVSVNNWLLFFKNQA